MKKSVLVITLFSAILFLFAFKLNFVTADLPSQNCTNSTVNITYCSSNSTLMTCSLIIVEGNETYNWTAGNCSSNMTCSNGSCINITAPVTPTINCTENWACTSWSNCTNNTQTRDCADLNSCNTTSLKPPTNQSCNSTIPNVICTNLCDVLGEKTCYNNTSYKTCVNVSGCLRLGNATSCSSGKVCSDGSCINNVIPCTIGEINGTKYCSPSKLWMSQKSEGAACSQSYECLINSCIDGSCQKKSSLGIWVFFGIVAFIIVAIIVVVFLILRKKPNRDSIQSQPAIVMSYPKPPIPPGMPAITQQPRPQTIQPQFPQQPQQPNPFRQV